ncbi:uncharacterized protein LOC117645697 [Thrips palmi]|uniref:Uncharacterized protein LOC117645697 n=1 Tax=Thrips palmi TaxID=161013 RepID=A0A6P8YWK2_THRPL|nr:uncharacterized protein LOC117645697 [Thrips palmi]
MKLLFHGIKLAQRTYNFPSSYFVGYINNMLLMKRSHETWPSIRILNTSSLFSLAAAAIKHRNNIFLDSNLPRQPTTIHFLILWAIQAKYFRSREVRKLGLR